MTKNWEGQTEAQACMPWEFSRVRTAVYVMYPAQGVVQVLLNGKNEKEEHACISVGPMRQQVTIHLPVLRYKLLHD